MLVFRVVGTHTHNRGRVSKKNKNFTKDRQGKEEQKHILAISVNLKTESLYCKSKRQQLKIRLKEESLVMLFGKKATQNSKNREEF